FPTPVGVFLGQGIGKVYRASLPHARGGVSGSWVKDGAAVESSPRPWGCFLAQEFMAAVPDVFPTPVGVFPMFSDRDFWIGCLPHARGGVSTASGDYSFAAGSSPRPWGCFR